MSKRSADYTIQGFIYQFNKTLLEVLLDSDDSSIFVEGIVEDVEVVSAIRTAAIQCKYHETAKSFKLSDIYKPVLQMIEHFQKNLDSNIDYILYAHFPSEEIGKIKSLDESDINGILASENQKLKKLIESIEVNPTNINNFCSRFKIEFAPSLASLVSQVHQSFIENGLLENDIETLIYPNAIQIIADLSIIHDHNLRVIKKSSLLNELSRVKKTAITHWTLELKSIDKILKSKRSQLKTNLSKNSRLRYFFISENVVDDFQKEIVTFISEYLEKYHFKPVHDKTPVFCLDCTPEVFKDIRLRLYKKNITINDGMVVETFDKGKFIKNPVRFMNGSKLYRECDLKLLRNSDEALEILNDNKCEDFFIFNEEILGTLDQEDINIELLGIKEFDKIKYVMGMGDIYV